MKKVFYMINKYTIYLKKIFYIYISLFIKLFFFCFAPTKKNKTLSKTKNEINYFSMEKQWENNKFLEISK